jgi:hypothetical protein
MDFSKLTDEELQLAEKLATWTKGKFSEEQFNNAKKVQEKTIAKGLNPDFILPMVMAESGFNQNAKSPKGADGVMQITPDTADFYKCKNVKDLDQNIDCGLNMISDLVSKKTIGNDPYKVLSGYNAGPNTKYFTSGKIEDLPDETIGHMDKVSNFYGGSLPHVSGEKPKDSGASETTDQTDSGGDADIKDPNNTIKPAPKGLPGETDPYAVVGGVTGASIASSVETGKRALPLIQGLYDKATGSDAYMHRPQSRASLQRYLNSQIAPDLRIPLKELEKIAGNGNPVRTMSEVQDALAYIKEVPEQKITKPVYKPQSYGSKTLIDTGKVTPTTIPGRPAVDLSAYKHTPTVATRMADQAANTGQMVKGALPSVGRIGLGAFGGAMAGVQGYDAWELAKKIEQDKAAGKKQETVMGLTPDEWRLASKSAATAGGVASMFPLGITQVVGGIAQAPELAWSVYDYLNQPKEAQTPKGGLSGQ